MLLVHKFKKVGYAKFVIFQQKFLSKYELFYMYTQAKKALNDILI